MYLENLVIDAQEPQRLGAFWEAALGCERLTDEPDIFETRLAVAGGPALDLCFQRVADPPFPSPRVHLDLRGGTQRDAEVERVLALGARSLDIGQRDVPWVVLGDPEGNAFCVLEDRAVYADTGPLAAVVLRSADPLRDGQFWAELSGWTLVEDTEFASVRHPSGLGPWLEWIPERDPKDERKNRLHLDLRLEAGDDADAVAADITERGGREVFHPEWGDLPWRYYLDPSGNEFCALAARTS
ncbi:VOC family protein [Sporichthya polymorpha]|uniref:VOC family protein n=1 Tax=Sporichthya polymorpha TaxID=35751 RepID=UPI00037E4B35|nr:VOC family protein [Sporichthya polymorpha]